MVTGLAETIAIVVVEGRRKGERRVMRRMVGVVEE